MTQLAVRMSRYFTDNSAIYSICRHYLCVFMWQGQLPRSEWWRIFIQPCM